MEDMIVEIFAQPCSKNGEGAFARDIVFRNAGMCSIASAAVLIANQFKEFAHILMTVDVSKQVQ